MRFKGFVTMSWVKELTVDDRTPILVHERPHAP